MYKSARPSLCRALLAAAWMLGMTATASAAEHRLEIARSYVEALHAGQWDRVRALTGPAFRFSDPTAEGHETVITRADDLETFLDYMQANRPDGDAEALVEDGFASGRHVTLLVRYRGRLDGEALGTEGGPRGFDVPGVTILTVVDGKVVHHLDYVDYETLQRQLSEPATGSDPVP
ncbi:MAG: ester cyclase [Gammaproteobacteria bacterium]|nr:ester cyclase [Gammaproteobacteria bacterium]